MASWGLLCNGSGGSNIPEDVTVSNTVVGITPGNVYVCWMERDEFSLVHRNHTLTVVIILIIIVVIDCRYSSAVTQFYWQCCNFVTH